MSTHLKHAASTTALALACALMAASCANTADEETTSVAGPLTCETIATAAPANATIMSAEMVAAGAFTPPPSPLARPADYASLPAFCRVTGSLAPTPASDIRFELWLPTDDNWNGDFLQTGNGGAAGSIVHSSMVDPLSRGYAVAHTDTGHKGFPGDFTWATGQPEKIVDYQYRAVHELTVAGKALTSARYAKAPETSVWYGCSTGGRQGLKEAQKYPDDYDAIVAGAPANNWSPLQMQSVDILNNLGPNGLAVSKLGLVHDAAITACDADDGVADGVISRPGLCDFDPASLACKDDADADDCLTLSEVAATKRLYKGPVTSSGEQVMPGTGYGSEKDWAVYVSPAFKIGTSYLRHVVLNNPDWNPTDFDIDTHLALAEAFDQHAAKAMDPDLSAFTERGGKLLMYHGTTDGYIPFENTVNYFNSVKAEMGEAADDSVRLFLVPGMGHCAGGDGAWAVDWLSALEDWTDNGVAPEMLPAAHPAGPDDTGFTRPVCAYPEVPAYSGVGDTASAANFACVKP